jgi:transmembrane protein TMEM260 (protein O-mannosyltransferase)
LSLLSPRLRSTSAILVAFAVPLGVYLASLRGDVSFWDTADLQTVPYILGIPYPTGFPGYVLTGWVWSHLFAIGSVAWRLNVLGAVACAGTAAALAALVITLGAATAIAFGAALAYALAAVPWSHATYVDAHPIGCCAIAWAAVYAVRWSRSGIWFDALSGAAALAAALAIDNSTVLALPGLALIALTRRPPLLRALVLTAGVALVVVAAYAYLPLRSAAVTAARIDPTLSLGLAPGRPFWDDGHPATWTGFARVVTGSDFSPHVAVAGMFTGEGIRSLVDDFAPLAARDLGGLLPWLALFGAMMVWWRMPVVLAGGLLLGLLPVLFAGAYPVESEATRYYLPAYFVIAVAGGYGVAVLDAGLHGVGRNAALGAIGLAWAVLIAGDFSANASLFAQTAQHDGRDWIERVASTAPAHAVVVAPWNYATTLAYGAYVLHALGDRIVVTADAHQYQRRYRDWLGARPLVVVSDDPETFRGFRVRQLDDGSPHLYALR